MRKIKKYLILAAGILWTFACQTNEMGKEKPKEPEVSTDPYFPEELLGKWELREIIYSEGVLKPYEPKGCIEFFEDSLLGWYDYETEEYIKVDGKYWVDSLEWGRPVPYWVLHCENVYFAEGVLQYPKYSDQLVIYNSSCHFINDDQMNLQTNYLLLWGENPVYIYKRIK